MDYSTFKLNWMQWTIQHLKLIVCNILTAVILEGNWIKDKIV